jgi:DNA-binding NarL/FixJ family response regulator
MSDKSTIILIIEKNEAMRRVIRSFVAGFSCNICECRDAGEAVQLNNRFYPEWVLMNLETKGADGVASILEVKKKWRNAKIVTLTRYDENDLREAARRAGAFAYVLKEDLSPLRELFLM